MERTQTLDAPDEATTVAACSPGLVFAGGGFPLRAAGLLVGAIGVSGASAQQDAELALAALERAGLDVDFGAQSDRTEDGDG